MTFPEDLRALHEQAPSDQSRFAINDLFAPGKFAAVPLVDRNFRAPLMNERYGIKGLALVRAESEDKHITLKADILPPLDESRAQFLDNTLAMIDPIVSQGQMEVDVVGMIHDYEDRGILSLGAVALFDGEAGRYLSLMVPRALVEDSTLVHAQNAARNLSGNRPHELEEAASSLTASVIDWVLQQTPR